MPLFDDQENYDRKMQLSEGVEHVRENEMRDKKEVEGYEPNPHDEKYYEVMGIKNSFDNVSVGADKYGQMLISVNSMKEPGGATLDSDRKKLKGKRRKQKIGAFGDFYTNLFSDRHGAFGFKADRNISDIRMMKEFENMARKRVDHEQLDAMPMLRLEDDMRELSELRNMSGSQNENYEERRQLEKRVRRETEYRDRFMARIRKARRKTYDKEDREEDEKRNILKSVMAGDTGDADDETDAGEDSTDDILGNMEDIADILGETGNILGENDKEL